MEGEIILTRDRSSGHVHKRVRLGDSIATLEGDNLDEAGAYDVLPNLDGIEHDDLCRNCFPPEGRMRLVEDSTKRMTL